MQKSDFYYDLPKERIAQEPADPRDSARLMCLDRSSGQVSHRVFHELPSLLKPGALLVVNNSKVLPARL
ncbi:MAG: S-adenosylmethionine:tRNA ribosyltransferase-isomerase, partial [Pygmaiobacter massiliensis]|nr:S-adenosylmethionine:tRNA ribosyltransferase-isomerase [Pygmaiobacter massiliensis]